MQHNKIFFRADGSSETGMGHLYRILSLADMLKEHWECVFIGRNTEEAVLEIIRRHISGGIVLLPDEVATADEALFFKKSGIDGVLVFDGYQFDLDYRKALKAAGFTTVYIDDFTQKELCADYTVNPAFITEDEYSDRNGMKLLGPDYALLRPAFYQAAQQNVRERNSFKSLLLCFGGSDPYRLTFHYLEALVASGCFDTISVLLGSSFSDGERLEKLAQANPGVVLYHNLNDEEITHLAAASDLALCTASGIANELCAVRIPLLTGFVVDNQENIYRALADHGLAIGLGDLRTLSHEEITERMNELTGKPEKLNALMYRQQEVFDGRSKERFINIFKSICKQD